MRIRVGVCQLDAHPAFVSRAVSYISEPVPPGRDDSVGLYILPPTPEIRALREEISRAYLRALGVRLEVIFRHAQHQGVELLLFPEYSIPGELLSQVRSFANQFGLTVVAGTHTVTKNEQLFEVYRDISMPIKLDSVLLGDDVRMTVCPVVLPDGTTHAVFKRTRSPWEGQMTLGPAEWNWITLSTRNGDAFHLGVLICSDALSADIGMIMNRAPSGHKLLAVPAWTPTTSVFDALGAVLLHHETAVAFANASFFGGSRIHMRFGTRVQDWFTTPSGSQPAPLAEELLVVADIDLDKQFGKRGSLLDEPGGTLQAFDPVLYPSSDRITPEFMSAAGRLLDASSLTTDAVLGLAKRYVGRATLPSTMKEKLGYLIDRSEQGALARGDVEFLLGHVPMDDHAKFPEDVRYEAVLKCLARLPAFLATETGRMAVQKYTAVMEHLNKKLLSLRPSSDVAPPETSPSVASETDFGAREREELVASFQDRANVFDRAREFEQSSARVLVIQGMRGIGKTTTAVQIIRKLYPKWNAIWIMATDTMRFPRFISVVMQRLGQEVTYTDTLCADEKVVERLIEESIEMFDGRPRSTLIIDDLQHLLDSKDGRFRDPRIGLFFSRLMATGHVGSNRAYVMSARTPKFGPGDASGFMPLVLHGLDPHPYMDRILEFWIKYHSDGGDGKPVTVNRELVEALHGNPLAAKLAAAACRKTSQKDLVQDLATFSSFQQEVVDTLLDHISMSEDERRLMTFLSTFRLGVALDAIFEWAGQEALPVLDAVLDKFLVELVEDKYIVHPLIKGYFENDAKSSEKTALHAFAASYFKRQVERMETITLDPDVVGEMVYHNARSDTLDLNASIPYVDELRPAALYRYRRQEYYKAIKLYQLLLQHDNSDWEVQFYLSLCYAATGNVALAQTHFDRAYKIQQQWWMYKDYGLALLRARAFALADKALQTAYELAPKNRKGEALAAIARGHDWQGLDGEDLYKEALKLSGRSPQVVKDYAHHLVHKGLFNAAEQELRAALRKSPRNRLLTGALDWVIERRKGITMDEREDIDNTEEE